MTDIVKVQRPLATNDPCTPWLMYAAKHKHRVSIPQSAIPLHVKKAMGGSVKAYFEGTWSRSRRGRTRWVLSHRVSDDQEF